MTRFPSQVLCAGGAALQIVYQRLNGAPPRPLRTLRLGDELYQQRLLSEILEPFLARWTARTGDERPLLPQVTEAALEQCLEMFRALRGTVPPPSGESVLAALAVTANLQRTLVALAERLAQPASDAEPEIVRLARGWCGIPPGRSSAEKSVPHARTLGRALGCQPQEIEPRCQAALQQLRQDLRRAGVLTRGGRSAYANRSGAVRPRKSSM